MLANVFRDRFILQAAPTKIKIKSSGLSSALHPESVRVTCLGSGSGSPLRRVLSFLRIRLQLALVARVPMNTQTILANIPTAWGSSGSSNSIWLHFTPGLLHPHLAVFIHSHSATAQSHLAELESNENEEV